nr:glycoside hydrolase family 15 protein [Ktedonobacter sp. SOSP1-52]
MLAEEVDPNSGELLGNFPQAFSHIGLVNAAWAIAQAASMQCEQHAMPGLISQHRLGFIR